MKFVRCTEKLYYSDFYLSRTRAAVVKVGPDFVELDATVAYPEGGGQEADQGQLTLADGTVLKFIWVKRIYAHSSGLAEFPDVQLGGVIWHMIDPADQAKLADLAPGQVVTVDIDITRRAQLSLSHTASHLVYLGVGKVRPDAVNNTIGCHIKVDGARFDFAVNDRITAEELQQIAEIANGFVHRDSAIIVSAHPDAPDARLWHTEGMTIPCGGTHLDHTAPVGELRIKRKAIGAGKERISCVFPQARPEFSRYHE